MRFHKLDINPAVNPAILDTATWDRTAAAQALRTTPADELQAVASAPATGAAPPPAAGVTPYQASRTFHEGHTYCLAGLPDGQQVFLRFSPASAALPGASPLGEPLAMLDAELDGRARVAAFPTDAAIIHRYLRDIRPGSGPQALGPIRRLGIGTRMTTAVWPAIWTAMARYGFAANAIQNSVRELNLLPNLLAAVPPEINTAFNFGAIETGYTGSTFEGLWVAGALNGLQYGAPPDFGADADHIQVKRGPGGLARAKALLDASRYYSFYTLDVSDVLNYAALDAGPAAAEALFEGALPGLAERRSLLAYHREAGGIDSAWAYRLDDTTLARLVGKYWTALAAVEQLVDHLNHLRKGEAFDLELSIDEHPPEVATFDCLTSETELSFLLLEARRRGLPVTHVAPNLGVEKGVDYACPDGLPGLAARCERLARIARAGGTIMDVHSGDDLSAATRQVIGRATRGDLQFKVSPMLQLIFAEVLADHHPELFGRWWEDALTYARRAAEGGSSLAAEAIRHDTVAAGLKPDAHGEVFHHFSFAFVGRRDREGQFLVREAFYTLSPAFYDAYQERIAGYLGGLAADLFGEAV